jgi:hypothetical protein
MKLLSSLLALLLLFAVVVSCRMAERFAGGNSGAVTSLWPDVPPLAGARKIDLQLPFAARIVIGTMVKGKLGFIAFATDKSVQEVKDFYSRDRMATAGWTPHDQGCVGDNEETKGHGIVCLFTRKDQGKQEGLAIVMSQEERSKETNLIYARFDMTEPAK